jgi:FkbM family methyltransferase
MLSRRIKHLQEITSHPLNRTHKARAALRYLRWILGRRLLNDVEYTIALRPDARVVVSRREKYATLAYCCGLYDFEDMCFLLHLVRPGEVVGDFGANVGVYSALASSAGATVLAVEPVPDTYVRLQRTLQLNRSCGLGVNCGLGEREGTLRFTTNRGGRNRVSASDGPNTTAVTVRTVDDLVTETGLRPLLLKVDVEGFELPVFRGAANSLQDSVRAIIVELNGAGREYGFSNEQVHQLLLGHGFQTYKYEPFSRDLRPSSGINTSSFNTLYVRQTHVDWVRTRVRSASPITTAIGPV